MITNIINFIMTKIEYCWHFVVTNIVTLMDALKSAWQEIAGVFVGLFILYIIYIFITDDTFMN